MLFTFAELQQAGKSATGVQILTRVAGVAALILVLTCANTTNLLLLRGRRRRREIAVRLAMGISRARLARQIVTETLILTAIAYAIGVASAAKAAADGSARPSAISNARDCAPAIATLSLLRTLAAIAGTMTAATVIDTTPSGSS